MGRPGGKLVAPTLARCTGPQFSKLLGAPGLRVRTQGRPRTAKCANTGEITTGSQVKTCLLAIGVKRSTGTEKSDAHIGCKTPQGAPVGGLLVAGGVHRAATGVAIKQAAGGAAEQTAELRVPHHPASRAVPVVTFAQRVGGITAANIVVQALERHGHQNGSAMAVHNGLGQAGRAARIDNPQGVIKRQPERLKCRCLGIVSADTCLERFAADRLADGAESQTQVVLQNNMAQRRQGCTKFSHDCGAVKVAPTVTHAIASDQYLGFNLFETVQHRTGSHVRCANAPHRTNADACQKRHHRLRGIGQVGNYPVPWLNTQRLQMQRERSNLTA